MLRPSLRNASIKEYSTIQGKRRLEIIGFLLSAWSIVALTVTYVTYNRILRIRASTTCHKESDTYMVSLSDPDRLPNGSVIDENGFLYPAETHWTNENGTVWGCPCLFKPCIHKCCEEDQGHSLTEDYYDGETENITECGWNSSYFDQRKSRVYSLHNSSSVIEREIGPDHFYVIVGRGHLICGDRGKHTLDDEEESRTFLMDDGQLLTQKTSWMWSNYSEYCVESSPDPSINHILVCFSDNKNITPEWKFKVRGGAMLVSVPCLLLTLLAYCLLPQLFNLHGKALICHVTSMVVAYSSFSFVLLTPSFVQLDKGILFCSASVFVIQFFVLAAFFWLNVLCFDIWWVFSGLMPLRGSQKNAEHFKFCLYSLYAWGSPLAIVLLTALVQYTPGLPAFIVRPEIGVTSCFFNQRDAHLLYLYLPLGVLVYLNTVMFVITALRFKVHSRSVRQLQRGDSRRHIQGGKATADVQRFNLYLKLSAMMGLNWALEILDFLVDSQSLIWIIPQLFNALQGLLYLYLFVCQRRILRLLNLKLCPALRIVKDDSTTKNISSARSSSSNRRPTVTEFTAVSNDPEPSDLDHSPL